MTGHACSRAAYQRQLAAARRLGPLVVCEGCRAANNREQRGRGVGRGRIRHPQPGPQPDMRLYPIIDLLAQLFTNQQRSRAT